MNTAINNKILIITPKKAGNTFKVASHLAKSANADLLILENTEEIFLENYHHIVLCSGVYADKLHANLSAWLKEAQMEQFHKNVRFHLYLTWFGRGKSDRHAMEQAAKLLEKKGFALDPQYGSCFGELSFIRKGHPNEEDLAQALQWLKQIVQ